MENQRTKDALLEYVRTVMIPRMQTLLRVEGLVATKKTSNSIAAKPHKGIAVEIVSRKNRDVQILSVLARGAKSDQKKVPSDMVDNLSEWMKAKRVSPKDGRTGRFKAKTEQNIKSTAFAIGQSIRNKGLIKRYNYSGSNIVERAFDLTSKKFDDTVLKTYADEVTKMIVKGK